MASTSLKEKTKRSNLTAPFNVDLGGMIPLSTVTVGAGGQASVEFTNIPGYYEHLQIRGLYSTGVECEIGIQYNSDTTTSNYRRHILEGNGVSAYVTYGGFAGNSFYIGYDNSALSPVPADTFSGIIWDILDYSSTNKNKVLRGFSGGNYGNSTGQGIMGLYSLLWMNTNAITNIKILPSTGSWKQDCHFAIYGIKRAGA